MQNTDTGKLSRLMHLWQTATLNAFAANRHTERSCGIPSCRTHLPQTVTQTVMPNAFVANRHAERICRKQSR
jgi:hypothetical protein